MNQPYIDYAHYNCWANNKIIGCLLTHNEKILDKEVVSSFSTIRSTILHIWKAEMGWLSRLLGNSWDASTVKNFKGTAAEMYAAWQNTSEDFKNYVEKADLDRTILWGRQNEQISISGREIAQTVFNHGSYHRGQIVVMMRQLGITEIPTTDYIAWRWEVAQSP
ncbi:MAG: DinB family protein [Bacteroidia bacterium]|nr:DinB family protein [Bacteroidia bacterium]NNJ55071.1 DNA polymerase [Bacteroidia bacterium]